MHGTTVKMHTSLFTGLILSES